MKSNDYISLMNRVEISEKCRNSLLEKAFSEEGNIPLDKITETKKYNTGNAIEISALPQYRKHMGLAAAAALTIGIAIIIGLNSHKIDVGESPIVTSAEQMITTAIEYTTETGDFSNDGISSQKFPISAISDEVSSNVYFGSEFPRLLYADDNLCIFTEGISLIYVFDFNRQEIVYEADIKATFEQMGYENLRTDLKRGPYFSIYKSSNGEPEIICYPYYDDPDKIYRINRSENCLEPVGIADLKNMIKMELPSKAEPRAYSSTLSYNAEYTESGSCIFLGNNRLNNDILPIEGSHLAMIDIIKSTPDGVEEHYSPFLKFARFTECKVEYPIIKIGITPEMAGVDTFGMLGMTISLPKPFEIEPSQILIPEYDETIATIQWDVTDNLPDIDYNENTEIQRYHISDYCTVEVGKIRISDSTMQSIIVYDTSLGVYIKIDFKKNFSDELINKIAESITLEHIKTE